MDLQIYTETVTEGRDYSWLAEPHQPVRTQPVTVLLTDFVEAIEYPDLYLKRGLVIAKYTSGANAGLWGPYRSDDSVSEGLGTPAGIVWDGFRVAKKRDGTLVATQVAGAVVLAGVDLQVFVDKLPQTSLEDGETPYVMTASDLPAAFVAVSLS